MKQTVKQFLHKEGGYVLGASFFTKAIAFISSLVLVRVLSPSEYGTLAYVLSALAFFIPFSGGGLQHSFMRFAPLYNSIPKVNALFRFSLIKGLLISGFIAFVLYLSIPFLDLNTISPIYFYVLLAYLFTYFFIEMVKVNYRVLNKNKTFASVDALSAGLLAFFGCLSAYYFGSLAYVLVLVIAPLLVGLFHLRITNTVVARIPKDYYY